MSGFEDRQAAGRDGDAARDAAPLTMRKVEQWLAEAQPNARLVYFTGFFAGDGDPEINRRLLQEQARGMVYLSQGKLQPGRGRDYIAMRSSRPASADRPKRPAGLREQAEAMFKRGGRA